ncbi:MAG: hypothetical protein ACR2HR_07200, partial [Euzebya sp.]
DSCITPWRYISAHPGGDESTKHSPPPAPHRLIGKWMCPTSVAGARVSARAEPEIVVRLGGLSVRRPG